MRADELISRIRSLLVPVEPEAASDLPVPEEPRPDPEAVKAEQDARIAELLRLVRTPPSRVTVIPSKRMVTGSQTIGTAEEGAQIVGFQPDRMRITLHNRDSAGGDAIYIAVAGWDATTSGGFQLAAAATITIETQAPIFARTASNVAILDWIIEFGETGEE